MAGGTGGHVFPGLAIAELLSKHGVNIYWLGTSAGLESKLVPQAGYALQTIAISGLKGKGFKAYLGLPWRLGKAVAQSMQIIRQIKPDLILGLGGYASGPGGIAAWLLKIPLIIHEQNARPGLTNKILARLAKKVLEGFPNTFPQSFAAVATGNPVRDEIHQLPPPSERFMHAKPAMRLLVLGGSLGAQFLNTILPQAIALMAIENRPQVVHQTGEKHLIATQKNYADANIQSTVTAFISDMPTAYANADLVVCRAGALTISELCAVGLGAILVPFPFSSDDHQIANAKFLVNAKAALLLPQASLTAELLAEKLTQFSLNSDTRLAMANAAYALRLPAATRSVLTLCEEALS